MSNVPTGVTNTFAPNTKARSADVNTNFTDVKNWHSSFSYDLKNGTVYLKTSAKSADYTVLDTDGIHTILMTTGASDRTVTLPTAADNDGRLLKIVKVDSGAGFVIIDGEGLETVAGATTNTLHVQGAFIYLQCDGTEWHVLAVWDVIINGLALASAVALTTNVTSTITSISVTPGTWRIAGVGAFTATSGNPPITTSSFAINSSSSSYPSGDSGTGYGFDRLSKHQSPIAITLGADFLMAVPETFVRYTSATTVYLMTTATFGSGSVGAYGKIVAVRTA